MVSLLNIATNRNYDASVREVMLASDLNEQNAKDVVTAISVMWGRGQTNVANTILTLALSFRKSNLVRPDRDTRLDVDQLTDSEQRGQRPNPRYDI